MNHDDIMMPWQDPPPVRKRAQVLWDYKQGIVVGADMCSLFDNFWTYRYDGVTVTGWWVLKYPGASPQYLLEHEVPEMVRLAIMVSE